MENKKKGLNISASAFLFAIAVLFVLMILTYALTLWIPAGEFVRVANENGDLIIDPSLNFTYTNGGVSFIKWLISPILVLGASGNVTLISVILFLLVIGGIFNALEKGRLMEYMLKSIIHKFAKDRYKLIMVVTFFFMAMGSFVGSFEEALPMVPIVTALAIGLGFDIQIGLGMSLIAVGCGFASGVMNPFTVGVAQNLAGIPMFSGMGYRFISGVLIYILLVTFLLVHAKKVAKPASDIEDTYVNDPKMNRGLIAFGSILGCGVLLILSSTVITFLQDVTTIIVVLMFLIAGIVSLKLSGMSWKRFFVTFKDGIVSVLPAILMILMASSIRFTLEEAKVMDTILYFAMEKSMHLSSVQLILFMYLIALVLNFFVSSGSAEAILLIPLFIPMAKMCGLSSQLSILAFVYGDGFSNVFYPTNPVLLISLGLVGMSYKDYVKWSWKFQGLNLLLTSLLLVIGIYIGY